MRYLAAKRAVEAKLMGSGKLRPIMFRPSLIWSWDKFDVLPVIPVFNIASALGVPFVDKTIRVEVRGIALGLGLGLGLGTIRVEVLGMSRILARTLTLTLTRTVTRTPTRTR